MRPTTGRAALGLLLASGVLLAAGCGSSSKSTSSSSSASSGSSASNGKPIVIGAAIDQTNLMKSFDDPALAAAKIEAAKINAAGGVDGHKIVFNVENDQLKPAQTRADALDLVNKGANILWVTCDVDFSTPSIQVGLNAKLLTVSPCIGTDQMGPKRFGSAGQLAFTFGNVAQDEGSAVAQEAINKGWKTANLVVDKQLVYSQNICSSFAKKFTQLGGKVNDQESWTQGDGTISSVVSRVNAKKAGVIVLCTTTSPDLPTFVSGIRGVGNNTPILGAWELDGAYWLPKSPKVSNNIWLTTYASVYGDDPNAQVKSLISQLTAQGAPPATGGFVTGASAIDAIAAAVKQSGGSTNGASLASTMSHFSGLATISGNISFSPSLHSVFGREYRIIEVKNGKPHFVQLLKAPGLANIG
jgi:branched-chain amino acid transport system substrate-binding protein